MPWFPARVASIGFSRIATVAACVGLGIPVTSHAALAWDILKISKSAWSGDPEAVAVFRFHNAGTAPVVITSVSTSCGCTTTELAKGTFAPGEAGEIKATMQIGSRTGHQEKTITVIAGGPPDLPAILTLAVDIQELVTCEPRLVLWHLGEVPSEKPVDLVAGPSQAITRVTAVPDNPTVAARVETVEAGRKYRLWIKPSSTALSVVVSIPCMVVVTGRPSPPITVFASVN
jgi:hypothetical protein